MGEIKLICQLCGKEYIAKSSCSKYCSKECKEKAALIRLRESRTIIKRYCVYCGKELTGHLNKKYCSKECQDAVEAEKTRLFHITLRALEFNENSIEGYDYVVCPICHEKFKQINMAHFRTHGINTKDELLQQFPDIKMTCQKIIDNNLKGDNNPMSKANTTEEKRKLSSPYSLEYYKHSKGAKTEEDAILMRQEFLNSIDRSSWILSTHLEYYTRQGYTEEESIRLRKEKYTANGLDWYIEKYGKEEGEKRCNNRILFWKYKLYNGKHHSSISDNLFENIANRYSIKNNIYYGDNEYMLEYNGKLILPDFLDLNNKKIVEFFGDYWHCNPNKFLKDDYNKTIKKYAYEIWDIDNKRILLLNNLGYKVLVVWESEYRKNLDEVENKILLFLENE